MKNGATPELSVVVPSVNGWSEIAVGHKKHYSVGEYLEQRYLYARAYAADRVGSAGVLTRVVACGKAFVLPPILLYRILKRVWRSGSQRPEFVKSLPLLSVFVCAWAAGEAVGTLAGDGGALARVC